MAALEQFIDVLPHTHGTERGVEPTAAEPAADVLILTFAEREKSRQRATLATGEEIALSLPRGTLMRGGDRLVTAEGRVISVVAAAEPVSTVTADDLVRLAYHLGNRHVSLQVGEGWVRYLKDHVLDDMVRGLGGLVKEEYAAFEPESGAYGHHHHD